MSYRTDPLFVRVPLMKNLSSAIMAEWPVGFLRLKFNPNLRFRKMGF